MFELEGKNLNQYYYIEMPTAIPITGYIEKAYIIIMIKNDVNRKYEEFFDALEEGNGHCWNELL